METEKNLLGSTEKEFTIRVGMVRMEDLGTDSPDLEITITNYGPSREIEYCISDGGSGHQYMQKVYNGDTRTFRSGDHGKGKFLKLNNIGHENAKVSASW